jgi:hypothetical protein
MLLGYNTSLEAMGSIITTIFKLCPRRLIKNLKAKRN